MLQPVSTAPVHLSAYEEHANPTMLVQMRAMASPMQGLRVVHINATADGGGVAETCARWCRYFPIWASMRAGTCSRPTATSSVPWQRRCGKPAQ